MGYCPDWSEHDIVLDFHGFGVHKRKKEKKTSLSLKCLSEEQFNQSDCSRLKSSERLKPFSMSQKEEEEEICEGTFSDSLLSH